MKKVTKSFVAILALVAMLTQNAFGVYAQATAPEPIQVENEYVSENSEPTVEVTTDETPVDTSESNEGDLTEPVDATLDVENLPPTDDVNYDDQIMLIDDTAEVADEGTDVAAEESVTEEVIEEEIPEQLDIYDNQISGSGLNELEIFIHTEQLVTGDSFRILFSGPDSAQYDTRLNDYLDTTSHGLYRFLDLNNEGFNIRATSDDNVTFEFASEDGRPVIKVISVESDADKLLFTKTIEDKNGKPVTAIKGEGLKDVSIKVNSEKLTDNAEYTVYVDTEAEVVMNGSTTDSISGTKSLESIELSNLNKKQFIIYISGDEEFEIDSDASVIDVVEGQAEFILESVATKTVYEYEDSNVYVRAVLERADAIPDDAYFSVEPITDTKEYLDAMNEGEEKYTDENTLLYDIAFYTDSTKTEEIEPEAGSVSVTIRFKRNQINEELSGEAEVEDVTVTHFEENGNTIEAVPVETSVSSDNTKVDFTVDSFSVYAVSATSTVTVNPGTSVTCDSVLGDAYYYGIVGNYVKLDGHLESNMAVGTLDGNANIATPKNEGGGAGVTYIGSYLGSKFFMDPNADTKGTIKVYTTKAAVDKFGSEMADRINSGKVSIDYSKSESDIKSIVSNMVNVVASNSSELANESTQVDYTELKKIKGTDEFIDISDSEAGTYYINYDNSEWANEGSSFKFKINSNQNLVLNIPDESVNFYQYQLIIDGKQYTPQGNSNEAILFEKVIYNCPNATYAATNTPVTGTFLLPRAGFYNNSVAAGFVVANRIEKIGGQEWHCISKNIPVIEDDKTELEIPVTKYFKDAQGNDIPDSEWPANGFKFKISKYPCNDPGDINDGFVEKDINYIPDIEGTSEVTIYGSTPNHTASFGKLSFNGAEVYNSDRSHKSDSFGDRDVRYRALMYKIEEIDTNEPGVVYDNATPLYIKVFVNAEKINLGNGTTKYLVWTEVKTARTVSEGTECLPRLPEFTNRRVDDTNIKFEGTKTVNGSSENVPNEKFEFSLYKYKGNNQFEENPVQTVKNNNNSFAFKEFKVNYNECTTYVGADGKAIRDGNKDTRIKNSVYAYQYYLIKETKCDSPYTANDKYIARVKIEKLFNNGVLSGYGASVEYFKYNVNDTTDITKLGDGFTAMSFDNTYAAKGETILYAKKELTNRTLVANEFTFKLYERTDSGVIQIGEEKTNDADGIVKFDKITYPDLKSVGPHTYVIKEVKGNLSGVSYFEGEKVVTVDVADNGSGALSVTHKDATESNPVVITNTYNANGEVTFAVTKKITGNGTLSQDKEFSFELKKIIDGKAETIETVKIAGDGDATFTTLKYELSDKGKVYKYTINEVIPDGAIGYPEGSATPSYYMIPIISKYYDGIKYDPTVHEITVKVDDNGSGKLVITQELDNTPVESVNAKFTNEYNPRNFYTCIEGIKEIAGSNKKLNDGDFTFKFELAEDYGDKLSIPVQGEIIPCNPKYEQYKVTENGKEYYTSKNLASGEFGLHGITFNAPGTYTVKVSEINGGESGWIYDNSEYTWTYDVIDSGEGYLIPRDINSEVKVVKNDSVNCKPGDMRFKNTYVSEGEAVIKAQKAISGDYDKTVQQGEFEFERLDGDNENAHRVGGTKMTAADGSVTFDTIKYTLSSLEGAKAKDFVYYVHEVLPDPLKQSEVTDSKGEKRTVGYSYDKTYHKVTVHVALNDATNELDTTVTYDDGNVAKITNKYEAYGSVQFGGNKKLIGRKFKDDDSGRFSAVLIDKATNEVIDIAPINKKSGFNNGGEFTFKTREYTKPGNYEYLVKEVGEVEGITNDTTTYEVTVSVTDINGDGKLTCVPTYGNNAPEITFVNTLNTPGTANVIAKKKLDFGTLKGDDFSFILVDKATGNPIDTKKNNKSGLVQFDQIKYTLDQLKKVDGNPVPTTFYYTISEVNDEQEEYEYSTLYYNVEITVSPGDDGLTTEVIYKDPKGLKVTPEEVVFENKYKAEGNVQFKISKTLTGRAMDDKQFSFELRDESGKLVKLYDEEGNETFDGIVYSPSSDAGKPVTFAFPEIQYTQADLSAEASHAIDTDGTFAKYYTIREVIPGSIAEGYTYDASVYNVQVTLKDNGKGKIVTDWKAYKAGEVTAEKNFLKQIWDNLVAFFTGKNADIVFENKYVAEGELKLKAVKKTNGVLKKGDFSFILSGKDENGKDFSETVENDANGNVVFSAIKYTKPSSGSYEYTIKEVIPEDKDKKAGFTYDETVYTVNVTVTDDHSGVLSVNAEITAPSKETISAVSIVTNTDGSSKGLCEPKAVEFVNPYTTRGTSVVIDGNKVVAGRKAQAAKDEFTFKLTGEGKELTAKTDAQGNFRFEPLKYTFEDYKNKTEYFYTVSEVIPSEKDENIKYSEEEYTVKVTLKDNQDGTLSATKTITSPAGAENITFVNTYNAKNSLPLSAKKLVTGNTTVNKTFMFELTGDGISAPIVVPTTNGGVAVFPERQYSLDDLAGAESKTYDYQIRELTKEETIARVNGATADEYDGYEFDSKVHRIHVVVSNTTSNGVLDVDCTVDGVSVSDVSNAVTFTNDYTANGTTSIDGNKVLTGRDLEEDEFTFILYDEDGKEIARQTNGEDGAFSFGLGEFTQENIGETYTYTVKEYIPENESDKIEGITYDDSEITVKVTVGDAGKGKLSFTKEITGGKVDGAVTFKNSYEGEAYVAFAANKILKGRHLEEGEFSFTLEQTSGPVQKIAKDGITLPNDASGSTDFGSITFDQDEVGTYVFKVTEEKGKVSKVTYSDEVYTATVTVAVVGGVLKTTKVIKNKAGETVTSIDFENTFKTNADIQFKGIKKLEGFNSDRIRKGDYSFVLMDENKNPIGDPAEVKGGIFNGGKFSFDKIEYTQDNLEYNAETGSYKTLKTYYVKEVCPDDKPENVTYDDTVYEITVTLDLDPVTGIMTATGATDIGKPVDELEFINSYTSKNSWRPEVVRTMKGKELEDGKYDFKITEVDEAGDAVIGGYTETVSYSGGAKTYFSSIDYTQDSIGTHYYKIEETETRDGSTKDSTVYYATVVVDVDDETQSLTVNDTYEKVFTVVNEDGTSEEKREGATSVVFENKFSAEGTLTLEGLKVLKGKALEAGDFSFAIMDGNAILKNNGVDMIATNEAAGVDNNGDAKAAFKFPEMKFTEEDLKDGDGNYVTEKTLTYTIVEQEFADTSVKAIGEVYSLAIKLTVDYAKHEIKATPTVKKRGEGGIFNLSVKDNVPVFTNVYDAVGQWDPSGLKKLTGRALKDNEFTFSLTEYELGKDINDSNIVKKDGDKNQAIGHNGGKNSEQIIFSPDDLKFLKYSLADLGKHRYIIKEEIPDEAKEIKNDSGVVTGYELKGVTYDINQFEYIVEVKDNGDGTLAVDYAAESPCKKPQTGDVYFTFNNHYNANAYIDLIGTKTFDGPSEFLKDFKFTIKETTEGKESAEFTVPCDEHGVITFSNSLPILSYEYKPTMNRDDRGTHTYEIREVIPADDSKAPGVKYDKRVYKVTVDVADDGEGKLVPIVKSKGVTSELNGGGQEPYGFFVGSGENRANYFTFENKYEANADLLFKGRKFLKRYEDSKDYITGEELTNFEFALYRVDATNDNTLIDYATASADGSFVLGLDDNGDISEGVKFTHKDIGKTYTYLIKETTKVGDGVVYDENVYEITVAVNSPAAGSDKLKLDVTAIDKSGATVAVKLENDKYLYTASTFNFTNLKPEYTVISGEKHWVGGPADGSRPDEVTIRLYASNVGVGQQVINTAVAKAPDWKYRFDSFENGKKLPAYTTDGQKIVYRVDEVEIPGYLSEKVEVVEGKVFDFYNTYGELLIRKVDAITGATLAGAELVILDSAGTEVDRWVSGTSAHAVDITKVEFDKTYTLREVSAPTGYKVAPDQTFTFKKGETTVVTMRDEKITGSVKLRKLDATTRAALEGAEFALYREDGSRVYASGTAGSYRYSETSSNGRFVVNAAGELEVTDLPYGSYYFTETVAPAGYIRSTDRFSFSVLTDGETVEVVALNAKEVGSVRLRKTNADGSVSLAGAVFELYAKTPTTVSSAIAATIYSDVYYRVGTYTTDASGEIYVGDLPWDDYYFVEVEAPAGYEVNTDVNGDPIAYTFTIGSSATATVSYDLGRITNSTTPPDTPVVPSSGGEVRGERRPTDTGRRSGGVLSGVLGVRAAPKAGVLGERLGPVTGDAFNIFLWTLLLLASIGSIIAVAIANARRKKNAR